MTRTTANLSTAAEEYYRLLLDLDDLFAAGRGECDEAEAIRDRMDGPWFRMTADEQLLMRRLSADLNDIGPGRPVFEPMGVPELAEYEMRKKAAHEAMLQGNFELPSQFLRGTHPSGSTITPARVRFTQASLWLRAGLPEAALRFLVEAERGDSVWTMSLAGAAR